MKKINGRLQTITPILSLVSLLMLGGGFATRAQDNAGASLARATAQPASSGITDAGNPRRGGRAS